MKIKVFGMGYVGCVTAACLANLGHDVEGIDLDPAKIELLNRGLSPIIEPGLAELIQSVTVSGRLSATSQAGSLGDLSLICVGTPSRNNGSLGLDQVLRVVEQIATLLKSAEAYHTVVVRSTVLPGTTEELIIPLLERISGKRAGEHFGVCMNPEFMRETSAINDFHNPPYTVIGAQDEVSAAYVARVYESLSLPVEFTEIRAAELIKYACNAFHATKVCFANEMGRIGKAMGIDSHRVMDIVCKDTKLNLSPYYLKPGFAFGGSCLPKDLRALLHRAGQLDVTLPMIGAILDSNRRQMEVALQMVIDAGKSRIGIMGLSFKEGTDDLRESPIVWLIENLIGKGYRVLIYDKEVSLARLVGSNKRYIETAIPHISSLLVPDLPHLFSDSEVVVVAKKGGEFTESVAKLGSGKHVIDLVRLFPNLDLKPEKYEGIAW